MSTQAYPSAKVFLGFALLGGALGGLLNLLFLAAATGTLRNLLHRDVLFFLITGAKLGTLPALLTGLWLDSRRVQRNCRGLLHATIAGAVFSALGSPLSLVFLQTSQNVAWPLLPLLVIMTLTGAISAFLLGCWLLPKTDAERTHDNTATKTTDDSIATHTHHAAHYAGTAFCSPKENPMTTPAIPSRRPYPILKIILGFALLGGALGGLLVTLFIAIYSGHWRIFTHRGDMLFFLISGLKLGTAPALLSGAWLAWRRAHRNWQGLIHAAIAGAFFSAITAVVSAPLFDPGYDLTKMLLVFMPPTGALSALLLGPMLLPKADKEPSYG